MGENGRKKPNLITIYVYNKKQLAQAQSMGGLFLLCLQKKNEAGITNCISPQPDSWLYWLLFSDSHYCCVAFFPSTTITLGGWQRKGCKGGAHILGDMTFLCQQEQNQRRTTQCWFAGKQREKTAESFLTSSCSSSGTSLPRGFCCQREESAWQPPMRSGQGLRDSIISPRD